MVIHAVLFGNTHFPLPDARPLASEDRRECEPATASAGAEEHGPQAWNGSGILPERGCKLHGMSTLRFVNYLHPDPVSPLHGWSEYSGKLSGLLD